MTFTRCFQYFPDREGPLYLSPPIPEPLNPTPFPTPFLPPPPSLPPTQPQVSLLPTTKPQTQPLLNFRLVYMSPPLEVSACGFEVT